MLNWKSSDKYNSDAVSNIVPERPGVYLLWVKQTNGEWRCFYVGKSDKLKIRLLEHLNSSEENSCIKSHIAKHICGFSFAETLNSDEEEKKLIAQHNPECNKVQPSGTHSF